MTLRSLALALSLLASLPAAEARTEPALGPLGPAGIAAERFPPALRPVAPVVSDRWRGEDERERVGEATSVMEGLGVRAGMTVADIGAGSGYYTMRLAARVGPAGRVLAQDVMPAYLAGLRDRVSRAPLANIVVGLGEAGDPRLPPASVDAALLIHMYHEIGQPFALMANLVPALRPGARVGIVDVDDATERHGTPLALLDCELAAVGYRRVGFRWLVVQPPRSEYLAVYAPPAASPTPETVRPCKG